MAEAKKTKFPIADGDSVDRISCIPQPILQKILSLLPPIDVIKTCVLSKTFNSALISFPVISLDLSRFKADSLRPDRTGEFVNYVLLSIQRLKLDHVCLQKFRLAAKITDNKHAAGIKKGIEFAIRNRVKELDIDLVCARYSLPKTIIGCGSIVTLNLEGLKIYNLNKMNMSCSWPLLESLRISDCVGLNEFKFSSKKIRSISLQCCDGLKGVMIQSPSLHSFSCANMCDQCDIDISECQFLKILSLNRIHLTDNWLEDSVPKLLHLEDLELISTCKSKEEVVCSETLKKLVLVRTFGSIKIRAPNLETLRLWTGYSISKYPVNIHPCIHLKHLSWKEYYSGITVAALREQVSNMVGMDSLELTFDSQCELTMFKIDRHKRSSESLGVVDKMVEVTIHFKVCASFLDNHSLLPKEIINFKERILDVTLSIVSDKPLDKYYLFTFMNWIASFGHVRVFTLTCSSIQDSVYPKSLGVVLNPKINDLKHVTINLSGWSNILPELVDSFLWKAPNLETLHLMLTRPEKRSIQFNYGSRIGIADDLTCCKRRDPKCVVLKNVHDTERIELVKYISNKAMVLNIIDQQGSDRTSDISSGVLSETVDNQRDVRCYHARTFAGKRKYEERPRCWHCGLDQETRQQA